MGIDSAFLRRVISVAADTESLKFVFEYWLKEDKRFFFRTYSPQIVYKACYALYKNIAEAMIEQLGKDLIVIHDVDYMDSVINTYFSEFPDIKDTIVRKQLFEYISEGAQALFGKENPWTGTGVFSSYLDEELKKNKMLENDETCLFVSGHTCNPKYAKKADYYNISYFLTNVFSVEVIDLLVDYRSWMTKKILRNNNLKYCFNDYYEHNDDYSENEKLKKWNQIISSEEERDNFIQSYIESHIYGSNKECYEFLLEYDDTAQIFLGKDIFTSYSEEQEYDNEYDTDEYEDDYEDW